MRDLQEGLLQLEIPVGSPLIIHASLSSIGQIEGGATAILEAITDLYPTVIAPTFTYKTMIIPEVGPPQNGISYGSSQDANRMARFFHSGMPADPLMGVVSETLRKIPGAERSSHPILSFAGLGAERIIKSQTISEPLAPIRALAEDQGWVLLLGVTHTVNTSIHFGERLAGRRQYIRWALAENKVVECPGFPGCSAGFDEIEIDLAGIYKQTQIGNARTQAVPLIELIEKVGSLIRQEPTSLLCRRQDCARCISTRASPIEEG